LLKAKADSTKRTNRQKTVIKPILSARFCKLLEGLTDNIMPKKNDMDAIKPSSLAG